MAEGSDKDDDFAAKPGGDDRSMGEILASIRKIVTDEERARRETDETRAGAGSPDMGAEAGDGGADILVLDAGMRISAEELGTGWDHDSPPLVLGLAALRAGPAGETAGRGRLARPVASSAAQHAPPSEVLSEDEVIALVRRVVREELKGPMGQQISRKVKALVAEQVRQALGDDGLL